MASYSILVLDADDRACSAIHVSEATDGIALQVAVGIIPRGSVAEVWLCGRMVGQVQRGEVVNGSKVKRRLDVRPKIGAPQPKLGCAQD